MLPITSPDKRSSRLVSYTAGTLSYTKAGLVILSFWLLWGIEKLLESKKSAGRSAA